MCLSKTSTCLLLLLWSHFTRADAHILTVTCTTLHTTPHALVTLSCENFPHILTPPLCSESYAQKI
jgi:hypothetical protein